MTADVSAARAPSTRDGRQPGRVRRALTSDLGARTTFYIAVLLGWQLLSMLVERMPAPWETFDFIFRELTGGSHGGVVRGEFWEHFFATVQRFSIGLAFGFVIGVILGVGIGSIRFVRSLLNDVMLVFLALPAVIWAFLTVMWFGLGWEAPVYSVILSTTPSWKYRALEPLPEAVLRRVDAARQYPPGPILPLAAAALEVRPEGAVVDGGRFPEGRGRWLAQSYPVRGAGWSLLLFSELRETRQTAVLGGLGAGFAAAFLISLFVYGRLRRKSQRERLAAAQALKAVSEDLERRIGHRTAELSAANMQLQE